MGENLTIEWTDAYIEEVARTMRRANRHTYQILTKRSERLRDLPRGSLRCFADEPHIRWGASVEDRRHGLPRVDHLREAPATVRFLSVEPLLEDLCQLDLNGIHWVIAGGESGPRARPDGARMGRLGPGPVPRRGRALLLQAVGRGPEEGGRTAPRRPHSRRDARRPARG